MRAAISSAATRACGTGVAGVFGLVIRADRREGSQAQYVGLFFDVCHQGKQGKTVGGPRVLDRSPTKASEVDGAQRGHRRDIDGLRGVSIAAVVLYHLGLGVSGGYGGVDIFFVISGFLIAGIIRAELQAGTFSIGKFYVRRIRRIVPAFVAMAVATTLAATWLLFPSDYHNFGKSLMPAAVAITNYHFQGRNDYFDGSATDKPLLHTWSLSVEEQFYLGFPLLLLVLFKFRRAAIAPLLAAIAVLSLAYSALAVSNDAVSAFFSTPARVWELLIGALVAYGAVPVAQSRNVREIEAASGAVMIAAAFIFLNDVTPFPGLAALPLCVGAALIIHAGIAGTPAFVNRVLSAAPIVGLGLISYSVYLVHWPLIVFHRYRFPESWAAPHVSLSLTLGLASLALGYLSWRFIETPFRRPSASAPLLRTFQYAGLAGLVMAVSGLAMVRSAGWPQRWGPVVTELTTTPDNPYAGICQPLAGTKDLPANTCRTGSTDGATDTILWGDSHAETMIPGFSVYGEQNKQGVLALTMHGCPPLVGLDLNGRAKSARCRAFNNNALQRALAPDIRRVVLSARWAYTAEGLGTEGEFVRTLILGADGIAGNQVIFARLLNETVARLADAGKNVVVIGPVPEQAHNVVQGLARHLAWHQPMPRPRNYGEFLARQRHVLPVLAKLETLPNVRVVYPHHWLCDHTMCNYDGGGRTLYRDNNHLSKAGIAHIEAMFGEIFAEHVSSGIQR